jgi:hypothetical protein
MRAGPAALGSVLALACASCGLFSGPMNYYVRELAIDPSLHLIPVGPRQMMSPTSGAFYLFFHTGTGLTTVDHFEQKPGAASPERLLYLETGKNQILDRTVKTTVVLKGPFGSVYSEKTCFYASPLERGYSAVSVHSYSHTAIDVVPPETANPPASLPLLTSVSLVRVFRASPEFAVVSADYEVSGALVSVNVSGAKNGDWVAGATHMVQVEGNSSYLQQYGIPVSMDIPGYVRLRRLPLPAVDLPQELTAVIQHYGHDQLIRVDVLRDGAVTSSRFLEPQLTKEEEVLNPACEARFRQQLAKGLPTVEGID